MQGVDAVFGGFAAGMNAIRARAEERDNIEYFARRCREMEEWGESGWDTVRSLRAENSRLRAANDTLQQNAAAQARSHLSFRGLLTQLINDSDALKRENARLKSRT